MWWMRTKIDLGFLTRGAPQSLAHGKSLVSVASTVFDSHAPLSNQIGLVLMAYSIGIDSLLTLMVSSFVMPTNST